MQPAVPHTHLLPAIAMDRSTPPHAWRGCAVALRFSERERVTRPERRHDDDYRKDDEAHEHPRHPVPPPRVLLGLAPDWRALVRRSGFGFSLTSYPFGSIWIVLCVILKRSRAHSCTSASTAPSVSPVGTITWALIPFTPEVSAQTCKSWTALTPASASRLRRRA